MNIKNFLLLLALIMVHGLFAKNPTDPIHQSQAPVAQELTCTLPPPGVLNVDNVGPGWVKLSWPLVGGASQYRIIVYDVATGGELSTTFVPGNVSSAQVSTAGSNGACFARIWSVCSDGTWVENNPTQSNNFDTIIVDLVGAGFNFPSSAFPFCTVGTNSVNNCSYLWSTNQTPYWVQYTTGGVTYTRNFMVNVEDGNGLDKVHIITGQGPDMNAHQNLTFHLDSKGTQLWIRFRVDPQGNPGSVVAILNVAHPTPTGPGIFYHPDNPVSGCVVQSVIGFGMLSPGDNLQDPTQNERLQIPESARQLTAKPNPFHDALTVTLPESNPQYGTNVRLYNLLGSVERTFTADAGQPELTVHATDLAPGVYFLRIESGGEAQTLKVVKTQ